MAVPILYRVRFKSQPHLSQIYFVTRPQRYATPSVRRHVDPPALPEQSGPDRTPIVENSPISGRCVEEYVSMRTRNTRIRFMGGLRKIQLIAPDRPAERIRDLR